MIQVVLLLVSQDRADGAGALQLFVIRNEIYLNASLYGAAHNRIHRVCDRGHLASAVGARIRLLGADVATVAALIGFGLVALCDQKRMHAFFL